MERRVAVSSEDARSSDRVSSETACSVWLNAKGAATRASVSAATITREARAGRLRAAKVGGRKVWRFRPEWVDAWLDQASTPAEVAPGNGCTR